MSITHAELAVQNFQLAQRCTSASVEWRITMLFYAAVHAADHAIFGGRYAPERAREHNHNVRIAKIGMDPVLRKVHREYLELKRLATTSRYLPRRHPMTEGHLLTAERLAKQVLSVAGLHPRPYAAEDPSRERAHGKPPPATA